MQGTQAEKPTKMPTSNLLRFLSLTIVNSAGYFYRFYVFILQETPRNKASVNAK